MSIKEKLFQIKNLWHVAAVFLFLIITYFYFTPAFEGYTINQGDVTNWSGSAQEIMDYRIDGGESVHWTNSQFSGMPGVQISGSSPGMKIIDELKSALSLWLPRPANWLFLYFIGFYILGITLKVKPTISAMGAVAYGLSSYFIIILQAGHNTKAAAIGCAPLVLASFLWAYRSKKMILPLSLAALFMTFELRANHLQITYYLGMVLLAIGVVELVKAVQAKTIPNFGKRTIGLLAVYALAIGINYGNIKGTLDYAKYTTRGGSELTIKPNGLPKEKTEKQSGLDFDYITAWSYGKAETFSIIVPNFKGGVSSKISDDPNNKKLLKNIDNNDIKKYVAQSSQYWGEQPFTSGPVYIGVIVVFLAFLALFYVNDKLKWALLAVTILTLLLSWGKNFAGFTEFFIDFVPGYNKFRAVTIILFVVELTLPLLAILFLNALAKNAEKIKDNIIPFIGVSGAFTLGLLAFYLSPSTFNTFLTSAEQQQLIATELTPQADLYSDLFYEIKQIRINIFKSDVFRSIMFLFLGIVVVLVGIYNKKLVKTIVAPLLMLFILVDLLGVDFRYIDKSVKKKKNIEAKWKESWKQTYPVVASAGDKDILNIEIQDPKIKKEVDTKVTKLKKELKQQKIKGGLYNRMIEQKEFRTLGRNSHFRVFEQGNPFNSSRTSYFHKSIGGYHGAKLGNYQEMIEFHLSKNNTTVLDMLNMKYMLQYGGGTKAMLNPNANGNAWFVKNVIEADNANDEILKLCADYTINATGMFPILVNGSEITTANIKGIEDVFLIVPNKDNETDTIPLQLPLSIKVGDNLSYINTQKGPEWAYTQMLDSVAALNQIVQFKKTNEFDSKSQAIVRKDFSNKLSSKTYTANGDIKLTSYHPDKLVYTSNSTDKQLAVFSEVYIGDGWKATIDGKPTEIIRVNYILRGIELPAGEHKIEMVYDVPSFKTANTTSLVLSIVVFLLIIFGLYWDVFKKEKPNKIVD